MLRFFTCKPLVLELRNQSASGKTKRRYCSALFAACSFPIYIQRIYRVAASVLALIFHLFDKSFFENAINER